MCFSLTIPWASENRALVSWQRVCRSLGTWGAEKTMGALWNIGVLCPCKHRMLRNQECVPACPALPSLTFCVRLDAACLAGLYLNFSCLLEFHWKFCLQWFSISQSCWKEGLNLLGMWMCCSCQLLNLAFQIKLKNCTSSSVLHFDYSYKSNLPILFYFNFVHPHV